MSVHAFGTGECFMHAETQAAPFGRRCTGYTCTMGTGTSLFFNGCYSVIITVPYPPSFFRDHDSPPKCGPVKLNKRADIKLTTTERRCEWECDLGLRASNLNERVIAKILAVRYAGYRYHQYQKYTQYIFAIHLHQVAIRDTAPPAFCALIPLSPGNQSGATAAVLALQMPSPDSAGRS